MNCSKTVLCILLHIACLQIQDAYGITRTWNGSIASIDWNEPTNWLPVGVPQNGDDVVISVMLGPKLGTTTSTLNSVVIQNGSLITIIPTGELRVSSMADEAILIVKGEIVNRGMIHILGGASVGIYLESQGKLSGDGQIDIHDFVNFGDEGIKNFGDVLIEGSLNIYRLSYFAVWNYGDFEIAEDAIFNIYDNDSRGLQTGTGGVTTNRGKITISGTTNQAIYCSGIMHNYDSIFIDSISSSALYNLDTFYNHTTGFVDIFDPTGFGATSGEIFENEGTIHIEQCSIGIQVFDNGTLTNSGLITIDSCIKDGLDIEHEFHNSGTITIERVDNGLTTFIAEPITNLGSITISNTRKEGIDCSEDWTNGPNASIRISNVAPGETGMYINGDLLNDGLIWISDVGQHGLRSRRTLTNNDSIVIMNAGSNGLQNEGDIANGPNATITVSNLSSPASVAIFSDDSITNDGHISVENAVHGIENLGILINNSNGVIATNSLTGDPFISALGSTVDCEGILDLNH